MSSTPNVRHTANAEFVREAITCGDFLLLRLSIQPYFAYNHIRIEPGGLIVAGSGRPVSYVNVASARGQFLTQFAAYSTPWTRSVQSR